MATQVQNKRLVRDAALTVTKALPGTSSNNTSDPIDIGSGPFNPEEITIEISIPAMSAHVTTGNIVNIQLYHGDATNSLAVTDPLIEVDQAGVGSTGTAAEVRYIKLPPNTKRYIAFHQITGGTDTLSGTSITYSLLT